MDRIDNFNIILYSICVLLVLRIIEVHAKVEVDNREFGTTKYGNYTYNFEKWGIIKYIQR